MARSATATKPAGDLMRDAPIAAGPAPRSAKPPAVVKEIPGLRAVAALSEASDILAAIAALKTAPVKAAGLDYFISEGRRTGEVPANFQGIEGEASASIQLRAKGTNEALAPEAVQLLNEAGVPVARFVALPRTYIVNPELAGDEKLVAKAGKALAAAGLPIGFIQLQEEISWDVVDKDALRAIFHQAAVLPAPRLRLLLETVAQPIVAPAWNGNPQDAADLARDELGADADLPPAERAVVRQKAAEKERQAKRYKPPAAAR
jgi:hypothetical protein